jgi:hypothetical protein
MHENETVVFDDEDSREFREAVAEYETACEVFFRVEEEIRERRKELAKSAGHVSFRAGIMSWNPGSAEELPAEMLRLRESYVAAAEQLEIQAGARRRLNGIMAKLKERTAAHGQG